VGLPGNRQRRGRGRARPRFRPCLGGRPLRRRGAARQRTESTSAGAFDERHRAGPSSSAQSRHWFHLVRWRNFRGRRVVARPWDEVAIGLGRSRNLGQRDLGMRDGRHGSSGWQRKPQRIRAVGSRRCFVGQRSVRALTTSWRASTSRRTRSWLRRPMRPRVAPRSSLLFSCRWTGPASLSPTWRARRTLAAWGRVRAVLED